MFLTIFRRFATIFQRFPKIFKMLSECRTKDSEHFPYFSEDCRRLPKIAEEDPKMFRLNIDKLWLIEHWNMGNSASWLVKKWYHTCGYHFYPHMCDTIFSRFATTRFTTAVYIIILWTNNIDVRKAGTPGIFPSIVPHCWEVHAGKKILTGLLSEANVLKA